MVFAWFAVFVWWLFGLVCVDPLRLVVFLGFVCIVVLGVVTLLFCSLLLPCYCWFVGLLDFFNTDYAVCGLLSMFIWFS